MSAANSTSTAEAITRPVLTVAPQGVSLPGPGYVLGWAAGWAVVGCLVATGIVFSTGAADLRPMLLQSVLFAEVVGFSVLTSTRLVFPLFRRFPALLRVVLQVLTLFAGALAGSLAVIAVQPLFILARPQIAITIVAVNSLVAVLVGIALHTYDSLRRQLEASYRALREKEAMERELEIARDVQQELLPQSVPTVEGLELTGICLPAIGVGGDYFDFLPFGERQVGLVIADVAGKGIPAALLMASLQAAVRSIALPTIPPREVAQRVNGMLYESSSSSRYATMFLGFYDRDNGKLSYSNAGHHPPLLVGNAGASRLAGRGRPIGMFDDTRYEQGEHEIQPGELLVLFTDGVVEAPGANDEEFGEQRLVDVLSRNRDMDLETILQAVLGELRQWSGTGAAHDDVTLVLARAR